MTTHLPRGSSAPDERADPEPWIRTVPPAAILAAVAWYGCTPQAAPVVTPEEPAAVAQDEPLVIADEGSAAPSPAGDEPSPDDDPPPAVVDRAPPEGSPRVAGEVRFAIQAKDSGKPEAVRANEVSWFLGSSSPNPSWAPDGRRIAYYDGKCVSIRGTDGKLDRTLRTTIGNADCRAPRWSPTGKRIVTSHLFHGPGIVFDVKSRKSRKLVSRDSGYWSLSFITEETLVGRVHQVGAAMIDLANPKVPVPLVSDATPVFSGFFPAMSATGRHLARVLKSYDSPAGNLELVELDLGSASRISVPDPWESRRHRALQGKRRALVPGPVLELEWNRAGDRLAAVRAPRWYAGYGDYDYGFGELLVIDISDSRPRLVAENAKNPSWSPDGKYIAYEARGGGIHLVDVTSEPAASWELHAAGIEPRWAPSGGHLLVLDPDAHEGVVLTLGG